MELDVPEAPQGNMRRFTILVVLAQVLGLAAVAMTAVWLGYYEGGFAWHNDVFSELNYHPLFMVIGMIFLNADAILSFRVFHTDRKIYIKFLHAGIQILALVFASVGLKAVFDVHNLSKPPIGPIPNLYSLHSWVGLATVILFGIQWLVGFMSFLFPKLGLGSRQMVMPIHRFMGMAIFCMSVSASLIGIVELALFKHRPDGYAKKPPVAMLLNSLGLVLVALAVLVIYIVSRVEYKRQPTPDEETK